MSVKIIQERLSQYRPQNQLDEENALKEIVQEIALSSLSRTGFFKVAAFQGGTCLRILHGLNRFSEDLDFALNEPDLSFKWAPFLKNLKTELETYGFHFSIEDRGKEKPVREVFIKSDSIRNVFLLNYMAQGSAKRIKIKLEIDTNPPLGAKIEQKYISFPVVVPVACHDLPSLFAGKSHALLCRNVGKGRDWFDFVWYVGRQVAINFDLLANAIDQAGPWKGKRLRVDEKWYAENLSEKIKGIDWNQQRKDIERFLKPGDLDLLKYWETSFFLDQLSLLIPTFQVRVSVKAKGGKTRSYIEGERFYYKKKEALTVGEKAFRNTPEVIMVEVFQSGVARPIMSHQ